MSTAKEIAVSVMPHFIDAVLTRRPRTYGYFARKIGRDPGKEAIIIGPAMHLIGAFCVFRQIPVAPLYYVTRDDGEEQDVFRNDSLEARHVLPHKNMMYVVAREYIYAKDELVTLAERLEKLMIDHAPKEWTPHVMWHLAVTNRPKNSQQTYWERALSRYTDQFAELRAGR